MLISFHKPITWLTLLAVAALTSTATAEMVLGTFRDRVHDIEGELVALSDRVLEVRGFGYDGTAPDAFFWADTSASPSRHGYILADGGPSNNANSCGRAKLGRGDGSQTVRIEFPDGKSLHDIAGGSISVWCRRFRVNFGEVKIPDNLDGLKTAAAGPPLQCFESVAESTLSEIVLGTFKDRAHDIEGELVALSDRVLEIRGFGYDGTAPDAFFWAGTSARPTDDGFILADGGPSNNCGEFKLGRADGSQTYRIEFPDGTSLHDIAGGSISVWCRRFGVNFGEVQIPDTLAGLRTTVEGPALQCSENAPESVEYEDIIQTPAGYNCEPLHEDFQVRWTVDGSEVAIELVGFIDETDYLGFGISGHDQKTMMVGADVIIGDLFQGEFRASDYYLSARAQCSNGAGVCPDMGSYDNSVSDVSGARDMGVTVVRYRRPLMATDSASVRGARVDRDISAVQGESTFIAWAMGPVSADTGFPNFHSIAYPRGVDVSLEFGRPVQNNCEPLVEMEEEADIAAFERPVIRGQTELFAAIGPSGGDRGYLGITGGRVGWGISWYVNDLLLPVIEMKRGTTYRFYVNGGDDPADSANYHPMYLTTSISGGYAQISEEEREKETIFGGVTAKENNGGLFAALFGDSSMEPSFEATAEAPICKYSAGPNTAKAQMDGTYEEFYASLDTSCNADSSITRAAAVLEFTPDQNTPDLLYYQCVTHRNLGWEIRVVDPGMSFHEMAVDRSTTTKAAKEAKGEKEAATSSMRGDPDLAGLSNSGAETVFGWGMSLVLGMVGLWMM